ncbi:MAG TPA: hypothetical protein VF789_04715 [Thermoanaerobaculia bacterium]
MVRALGDETMKYGLAHLILIVLAVTACEESPPNKADGPTDPGSKDYRDVASPSPLEGKDTSIFRLASKDGEIAPVGDSPYLLDAFSKTGAPIFGFAANFRDTRFEISDVEESLRDKIVLGAQFGESQDAETTVAVEATRMNWFYVDKEYLVYPPGIAEIEAGGPFLTLEFFAAHEDDDEGDAIPLDSWNISVIQEGRRSAGVLNSSGKFNLAAVGDAPIEVDLEDPPKKTVYRHVLYPKVRGATAGLVRCLVWRADGSGFEVN